MRLLQSFFWYNTDFKIVLCCLHRLYSVVGVIPKDGLAGPARQSFFWYNDKYLKARFPIARLVPLHVFAEAFISLELPVKLTSVTTATKCLFLHLKINAFTVNVSFYITSITHTRHYISPVKCTPASLYTLSNTRPCRKLRYQTFGPVTLKLLLRMYWWITAIIFGRNWLLSVLFDNCKLNCYQNRLRYDLIDRPGVLGNYVWAYHCRGIVSQAKHKYYRKNTVKSPLKLGYNLMPFSTHFSNWSLFRVPISTSLNLCKNAWEKYIVANVGLPFSIQQLDIWSGNI